MPPSRYITTGIFALLLASTSAWAQDATSMSTSDMETIISRVSAPGPDGVATVDIRLLNTGAQPRIVTLPDRIEARIEQPGGASALWLERSPDSVTSVTVQPGAFAAARYVLPIGIQVDGALLSVPAWGGQQIVVNAPPPPVFVPSPPARPDQADGALAAAQPPAPAVPPPPADRSIGNDFVDNLTPYEPIYAVYGPGTNSDARIQFSFKYRLFGSRLRDGGNPASLIDGLHFAYTQRMFWDLGQESSPFRNIDFQPELFYLSPSVTPDDRVSLMGQIGMRHESNGRAGTASRSLNTIYFAPMAAFSLPDGVRLTVSPRLWLYAGDLSDNPDIGHYRGNTGLYLQIGKPDGLRLSTDTRFNVSSGKGALSADLSYPLRRILGGGPDFYLFGQSFIGYGENVLDYNKHTTRLRIGVALVR